VKQAGTAAAMLSQGGIVHKYASGGPVSALGQYYAGNNSLNGNAAAFSGGINPAIQDQSLLSSLTGDKPEGLSNSQAGAGAQGIGGQNVAPTGATDLGSLAEVAAHGALIPGRAKVKGDSSKNDTVPAVLSPGEIVIPRSIAQGKDAPKRAAEFVAKVLAKNGLRKK
jgi:hypothetical protein